ncbi:hypothetical protein H7W66_001547 [Campylobacter coli]|uniref:MORN repeat protein n=1 Tax=Helicobacter pullorum MIT 98-5489 TaxID=537972 RepID=C5EX19_9HELI|nr:hypothetical protein [Helicobacter pullorum]ECQ5494682.1 hypothetical protein [Campylobacter coli]EDO9587995.1 hypothetical protein [Campylobacter coli]EEQ62563.1 MORN repeat protein [Helicobacter pullorum MIT 98-5489]EFB7094716.1 hypothetical protein [Campylobacter coli]EFS2167836.1 hypothetical protein [Campylobacter coli]
MINKKILTLSLLFVFLCGIFYFSYKNIHTATTLNGESTKIITLNNISYDIYNFELFSGEFINVYDNGNKKMILKIRKGKLNGTITEYYSNGIIKFIGDYYNNQMANGCASFYYQNGNLSHYFCYKNGKQDGSQVILYENGNMKVQAEMKQGRLMGTELIFRENGTLLYEIDNNYAIAREFDENGNFIGIPSNEKVKKIFKSIVWKL